MFKKKLLTLAVSSAQLPQVDPVVKAEQENHDDIFYSILMVRTLIDAKLYGGLAWHLWHKDEELEKKYVVCEYAKQLIQLELKQHDISKATGTQLKMITNLGLMVGLPYKRFFLALDKIIDNPDIREKLGL